MEQKWLSLFLQIEAWFDWRRTGYPVLKTGSAAFYGPDLPLRFMYPAPNLDPNYLTNYEAAINRLEPTLRVPAGQSSDHHYSNVVIAGYIQTVVTPLWTPVSLYVSTRCGLPVMGSLSAYFLLLMILPR